MQLQQAIFDSPLESQSQNKQQTHCNTSCNSGSSGQPAATHISQHDTMTASAFSHDDPLMPELLSWISCAAVLGGLAGSVAVTTCCKAIRQAAGCPSAPSLQQSGSDSDAEFDEQLAMYEEDTQPGQALDKASRMSSWTLLVQHLLLEASDTQRLSAPLLHAQLDDSMPCHGAYCLCCEHFAANL